MHVIFHSATADPDPEMQRALAWIAAPPPESVVVVPGGGEYNPGAQRNQGFRQLSSTIADDDDAWVLFWDTDFTDDLLLQLPEMPPSPPPEMGAVVIQHLCGRFPAPQMQLAHALGGVFLIRAGMYRSMNGCASFWNTWAVDELELARRARAAGATFAMEHYVSAPRLFQRQQQQQPRFNRFELYRFSQVAATDGLDAETETVETVPRQTFARAAPTAAGLLALVGACADIHNVAYTSLDGGGTAKLATMALPGDVVPQTVPPMFQQRRMNMNMNINLAAPAPRPQPQNNGGGPRYPDPLARYARRRR